MFAPLGFSLALVQTILAILSFFPLEMGVFILCHPTLEVCHLVVVFVIYFIGAHCKDIRVSEETVLNFKIVWYY